MHGSGRLPELLGPCHGHHWVRVSVGSTLVTLAGRRPHRWRALTVGVLLCFGSADGWGPADPRARLSAPVCVRACSDPGGSSIFEPGFSERIKEMIYRFCLNALEIHNLLKIAPNLLK